MGDSRPKSINWTSSSTAWREIPVSGFEAYLISSLIRSNCRLFAWLTSVQTPPELRVKVVPQAVSEEVECENRQRDGDSRKYDQPPWRLEGLG